MTPEERKALEARRLVEQFVYDGLVRDLLDVFVAGTRAQEGRPGKEPKKPRLVLIRGGRP